VREAPTAARPTRSPQSPSIAKLPAYESERADKDYPALQNRSLRRLPNSTHPPIHANKYSEADDVWQGRVNRIWRLYFLIDGDEYVILSIIPHPKESSVNSPKRPRLTRRGSAPPPPHPFQPAGQGSEAIAKWIH
jgi:hypothetical protein